MKNKVVVITTEGCEGCKIQIKNVKKAITYTSRIIDFDTFDYSEYKGPEKLTDFPTTLYYIDEELVGKDIGTQPVGYILGTFSHTFK